MGCGAPCFVSAGTDTPEAVVLDEEDEEGDQDDSIPKYWTNKKYVDTSSFKQMFYVSQVHHRTFDKLLNATYAAISTKDRPCPKASEQCDRQTQGCPCVRVGGIPGLPTKYITRRVVRVENSSMWARFAEKRASITEMRKGQKLHRFHPPLLTASTVRDHAELFGPVFRSINEVYLWHGTHVRTALSIAQQDFNIDLAGQGRGSMFGPGAYFAESCTKADEYAFDEPGGFYDGVRAMLLCRVCMGKMYYTTKFGHEEAFEKIQEGNCDSVLGDMAKHRKTFREFVVYDADQVYPEYVVIYQRIHRDDDLAAFRAANIPYHLELPVYWKNCHLVPSIDEFDEQLRLRRATCDLLQRLVSACADQEVKLQSARRVESSMLLNKYTGFKVRIKTYLSGGVSNRCVPPDRLAPDQHDVGHVRTFAFLRQEGDFTEESISIDNLEQPLNEHLLWYGASKEEVDSMAHNGLDVTRAGNNPDFWRFGPGLYLSDTIDQILGYAEEDDSGLRHVLLCRTCCGEMYYTEEESLPDADDLARHSNKHSVFANASKSGMREFVVLENEQVYPEFVLDLSIG